MKDYPINIFWSENDASYVADIPDLFPCTGFGDTPQRALAEVMLAREAWIETARGGRGGERNCLTSKTDA